MKKHFKNLMFLVLLFLLGYFFWSEIIGTGARDIKVVDWSQWILLVVAPATFIYFLIRALSGRFKSVGINIGLLLALLFITYFIFETLQIMEFILVITAYNKWHLYGGWAMFWWLILASVFLAYTIFLQRRKKYSS